MVLPYSQEKKKSQMTLSTGPLEREQNLSQNAKSRTSILTRTVGQRWKPVSWKTEIPIMGKF